MYFLPIHLLYTYDTPTTTWNQCKTVKPCPLIPLYPCPCGILSSVHSTLIAFRLAFGILPFHPTPSLLMRLIAGDIATIILLLLLLLLLCLLLADARHLACSILTRST